MASITSYATKHGKKWRFTLSYKDDNGNYRQSSKGGFKTKKEANLAYSKAEVGLNTNGTIQSNNITLNDLFSKWFKVYATTVKESTSATTKGYYNNHIKKALGMKEISLITVDDCQNLVNDWFNVPLRNYHQYFGVLRMMFDFALKRKMIPANPTDIVTIPKKDKQNYHSERKKKYYTAGELNAIMKYFHDSGDFKKFMYFWLMMVTGARRGEMIGLKWSDIDLDNRFISINRTQTRGVSNRVILQTPKTKSSKRSFNIDDQTASYLNVWKQHQKKILLELGFSSNDVSQFVFTSSKNKMISDSQPRQWLLKACKDCNIQFVNIHGLRHTYVTLGLEGGMSIKQIQNQLGHASSNTTMNIYADLTEKQKNDTPNQFRSIIGY